MILCVDTKVLKVDRDEIQKDINIEDLLNNHTQYFNDAFEAKKAGYIPVVFSVSIRSMYDNTVVAFVGNDSANPIFANPIFNYEVTAEYVHKGYDLVMFMSSIGVMQLVNYEQGFDELMSKHSQFDCIGLYVFDDRAICPRIYSHIILSDEGMKEFNKYLKDSFKIVPIKDVNAGFKALCDTLVIVKEKNNE